MKIKIRAYQSHEAKELADLFYHTVHSINSADYTVEELNVWAPTPIDYKKWQLRFDVTRPLVAEIEGRIVGFAELKDNGHIDCFYVHRDFQRQGVGKRLMEEILDRSAEKGLSELVTEASITAKPFFISCGFITVSPHTVKQGNYTLKNYIMKKVVAVP